MRIAGLLLCCCAALLAAGCTGQDAATPSPPAPTSTTATTTSPDPALEPKIVVQQGHQSPVLAVHWVDGGRHLVSLARDGSLVIWNIASGTILDHAQVPLAAQLLLPDGQKEPPLRFHAITDGPAAGTLAIAYMGVAESEAKLACPGAHQPGTLSCTYVIDLATRAVRADATLPMPSAASADDAHHWPTSPDGTLRPAPNHGNGRRGLPDTSDEHFGSVDPTCTSLQRCRYGVTLLATGNGAEQRVLTVDPRGYFVDADLSPDGLRLLRVVRPFNEPGTRVEALDLSGGNGEPAFAPKRAYHRVRWLDATHYLLGSEGYGITNDTEDAMAGYPPALVVDPACATREDCAAIDSRWQMRPADAGAFVALGSLADSCFTSSVGGTFCMDDTRPDDGNETYDPPPTGLAFHAAGARNWQPLAADALADQVITAIETSPDHRRLAVATRAWDRADAPGAKQVLRVWLLGLGDGGATAPRRLVEVIDPLGNAGKFTDDDTIRALSFSADGRRLVFTHAKAARANQAQADLHIVDTDEAAKARTIPGFARRAIAVGDNRVLGLDDGTLLDLDSGRAVAHVPSRTPLVRAGWIERSRLLWATTEDGKILFWDSGDGTLQLTLHTLPDNRYFAIAPGGRYDTNLGADTALVRWLVPDAPWRSLAAQTFMRDYYEPGLYRRLLDCRASDTCARAFAPLPAIASLNRVLPEVRITGVHPGSDVAQAVVAIEVREGVDADAPNGKTRSGLYNPRLFRNGKLVAMAPRQVDAANTDLVQWRSRNAVQATDGVHRLEFTVPLPTQADEASQVFSAYAFNEDRIKGETATLAWTRPAVAPRSRRAYVLAIGIDHYDTARFRLNYAVADARLMAARLSAIPGYETHQMLLAAERSSEGRPSTRVDRATLTRVLSLLAGDGDRQATLAALRADGIDAGMLQAATPDDAVIVSYSGHGWANPRGDFYLIPSDGRWPEGSDAPDLSTVLSTADLVMPFQAMRAGEIALVIDACHSAASVADGRFKPGPMGDSGLGQLAYDKGIRILAATQADDVALEDARLGQGLLTYALAVDGLGAGDADLDGDGSIRIDEWLAYAVRRLPTLAADARVGRITAAGSGARAITFHDLPADAPARRVQQPALFDFNPRASAVVLRREAP
ncbi:caspase family protein [Lysobacter sp. S4-A87]|uniref:caspase family protein n=1 Tax=Lysobacter sp. S4-A87 TaxID=2925843 RepID=UPI001F52B959|nr:caspase family protein [Lysobacter sp. S4-A87]UNK48688.1 caspase family protein [Lysobacter sp. S4-A87]